MSHEQGAYIERQTISIDESKCTGCGTCASACAEGVIAVIGGVAKVVNQDHCDGLGVCVGECPQGAISFTTVRRPVAVPPGKPVALAGGSGGGCPLWDATFDALERPAAPSQTRAAGWATPNWPIKLRLTPADAPWLRGADLAIWADCAGFVVPAAAQGLPGGSAGAGAGAGADSGARNAMIIGCPKFDDRQLYLDKLADIFRASGLRSVSIYHMTVSCCGSMIGLVKQAQEAAGTEVPVTAFKVEMDGSISDGRSA